MIPLILSLLALAQAADPVPPAPSLGSHLAQASPAALGRAARAEGDARRGALVFYQPSLACARCHVAEAGAKPIGPDLSGPGAKADEVYIVESILAPSRVIRQGYEAVTIARTNGETVTGLLDAEDADKLTLRDPADGRSIVIPKGEIEARKVGELSTMPAGLVEQLPSRGAFLDLVRYLVEIAEGGPDRARQLKPSASELAPTVPDYERDIDHAGLIAGLDDASYRRGEAIYGRVCANCHGTKTQVGSLPTSLRFASGAFKNGGDPLAMYRTLTLGYGQMAAQGWMVPSQKYDVIHYIREAYLRADNPTQYARVDRSYLDRLPKGKSRGPAPSTIEPWSAMDYGPTLTATYEVGDDGSNFAFKGIAVRLDAGAGGVSRGHHWAVYDHDTMRLAAAWSGSGFIDWNGINFNGRHGIHPRVEGLVQVANPAGPGWANPSTGLFEDPRTPDRDGRSHGPLPKSWVHYRGQYRHGDRVVLSYSVGETSVLEMPGLEITSNTTPVLTRTFELGARPRDLTLRVARRSGENSLLTLGATETRPSTVVFPTPGASKPPAEPGPLRFDGATRIEVAKAADFDLTGSDYTISARFQTRQGGTLFAEAPAGDEWAPNGKTLFVRNGRLVFDIGWVGAIESRRNIADGAWHDAALTFEHQTGRVSLYLDGKLDRQGTLKPKKALAARAIRIGFTAADFPVQGTYFKGRIAEVKFLRGAFRPDQAIADDRLVARWKLDDAKGDVVEDASGRGHVGKVAGKLDPASDLGPIVASASPEVAANSWVHTGEGDLLYRIAAGPEPIRFTLRVATRADDLDRKTLAALLDASPPPDLAALTRGGPARWPEVLKTSSTLGDSSGPFASDTLAMPEANPWLCQMRPTGFDFTADGRGAFVCTWDGDVWRVEGLTDPAGTLSWRRIASGLFQPLGLKVLNGKVFVGCRDQVAILNDLNRDGETDFYENFNSDHQVTEHFHEFAMDLQADRDGNLYYAKGARHGLKAVVPHHGTLLKIARDGSRTDILATGFRAPNGVRVEGDGTFYLTDQEGFWTPKNRINKVKPGGFYGNLWGFTDVTDPADSAMEPPVCWITNAVDRSPAEVIRVEGKAWGPLEGALLNLSYGEGKIYAVPTEEVGGVTQGGVSALPLPAFPTGLMRGRFSPVDGQLYACGMFAWAGNRTSPGGFYRVRATGKAVHVPIGLAAKPKGMLVTFSGELDPSVAADPSRYSVKTWSLKRSAGYGSEHFGERPSKVLAARPTEGGRGVFLEIEDFGPTQCMEIRYDLKGRGGEAVVGSIDHSVHRVGE